MSKPLITIEYDEYLKLQISKIQMRLDLLNDIRRTIENNENS